MAAYLGIDVGTGSARAGLFDGSGRLLASGSHPLEIYRPAPDFAQQSSTQIWQAVCKAVEKTLSGFDDNQQDIKGIGIDATCSLVVTTEGGAPVSVSPDENPNQDVIVWMDHRAIEDAGHINALGSAALAFVGGAISPEMQTPKLRWLKHNAPHAWAQASSFWDLPDWLVHRATGTLKRSICSTGCKWTYNASKGLAGEGWDRGYMASIGLDDLIEDNWNAIGNAFAQPGESAGRLSDKAARELALPSGIPVAAGMIDAYAGALGTLFVRDDRQKSGHEGRLALVAGTSACHIAVTQEAHFVKGVWGPYLSALLPGTWVVEGGQSAAGALLDTIIARHSASAELQGSASEIGDRLADILQSLGNETATLTHDRHVQPDVLGNRSPLAEPWRQGAISGISLRHDVADLALDYLAAIQALAYGTRHIIDEMRKAGIEIDTIVVSGGLSKNRLYLREHADATGCRLLVPESPEPVLLGAAVAAAAAANPAVGLHDCAASLAGAAETIYPRIGHIAAYHDAKFQVYRAMQRDFAGYRETMQAAIAGT